MPKPKIVIFLQGGLISEIYTDQDMEIANIDYDVEGAGEEELGFIVDEGGNKNSAFVSLWENTKDKAWCNYFLNQVKQRVR